MATLFEKADPKDIKNYSPINLLSHSYKISTRLLRTRIERTLDENQPRGQARFRNGYSTSDYLESLNQTITKSNEYNLSPCIGFIDYEKAFDIAKRFVVFEVLRKTNIKETYIKLLQNIYSHAKLHPLPATLFTANMEEVFQKADVSEGINVDKWKKTLQTLGLPMMLLFSTKKQNKCKKTFKQSELRKSESWPKSTRRKLY